MRISDWSSDVCSSDLLFYNRVLGIGSLLLALYDTHILLESNVLETVEDLRVHVVDSASVDGVDVQVDGVGSNEYASSTAVGKIELGDSTRESKSSCSREDSVERDEGDDSRI